jgi:DHA1 family multidrug resistance protein-like MFS transporter
MVRLRESEHLLILCGATFLVMAGQGVVGPLIPRYATEFGVGAAAAGLTLSVYAFARLLLNFPAGVIADKYGRRVLLVGGPLVTSVGMIGSGFAGSITTLLIWRFVAGAGSALYMSGALIYLIDIAKPDQRAGYVATNQWALSAGVAIGPGIGGLLAEWKGLAFPFIVVGVLAIFTAVYAAIRIPETLHLARAESQAAADKNGPVAANRLRDFVLTPRFAALALMTATIFMTRAGTRGTLVSLYSAGPPLNWGEATLGTLFTLTGLLTLFTLMPAARGADRFGRANIILFSGLTAGIGTMLIAQSTGSALFVAGNIVMAIGTGTSGPAPAAFVADIAPADIRGKCVAAYRSAGDIGFILGPPLLGWLADATNTAMAFRTSAVLVAAAAIWFVWVTRREPAAQPQHRSLPN